MAVPKRKSMLSYASGLQVGDEAVDGGAACGMVLWALVRALGRRC
jgi:hypothetical protein